MTAFFNFESMLTVCLLMICTCSYIRQFQPQLIEPYKDGFLGFLRRAAVIGIYSLKRR